MELSNIVFTFSLLKDYDNLYIVADHINKMINEKGYKIPIKSLVMIFYSVVKAEVKHDHLYLSMDK